MEATVEGLLNNAVPVHVHTEYVRTPAIPAFVLQQLSELVEKPAVQQPDLCPTAVYCAP